MPTRWTQICIALGLALLSRATYAGDPLVVIVHPSRVVSMNRPELARIFLKKQRFWDDGDTIVAINREAGSAEREQFSSRVLGGDSMRLAAYWNEQYFQGILPPATLSSAEAVKQFVASERNAIGYIFAAQLDDSVKAVLSLP